MVARMPTRPLLSGRFFLGEPVPVYQLGQAPVAMPDCNIPAGYGSGGRAVIGCSIGNALYNVIDAVSGTPVMSSVSSDCLRQFGNFTIAAPGDQRCGGAGSPSLDPCGISADLIMKPVIACPMGGGSTFNIIDPATNTIVMSNVPQSCLANFKSLTISTPIDGRCMTAQPAPPSIISNPGARNVTFPLTGMQWPWSGDPPPIQKVGGGRSVYDVLSNPPAGVAPPSAPVPPAPAAPSMPLPSPALPVNAPPLNTYAPGQPIPVADWFGICKQMPQK